MTVRALLALLLAAFVVATLWLFVLVPSANPHHADAIVVLAGEWERIDTGLRLLRDGVAPTLVLSRGPYGGPEEDALCARTHVVCIRARPFSTQGEAEAVSRMSSERGWRRLVVVTSRYHVRRARILFGRCLHSTPAFVASNTGIWRYLNNIPREWAKLAYQETIDRGC